MELNTSNSLNILSDMPSLNNISIVTHNECTGCKACVAMCPESCISMKQDGIFFYPEIDVNRCINCGKCIKICPAQTNSVPSDDEMTISRYYCAWNKDDFQRKTSTSGGVGSAFTQYAIDNGFAVCGVTLTKEAKVKHIISEKAEVVDLIKGSKYVESNIAADVYQNILSLLKVGKRVLFFGTPCQVSALQNMMPNSLQYLLLTCEIVCHGINSSIVWEDFVEYLQNKYHSVLGEYNFRSKSKGWGKLRVYAKFENGKYFDEPAWKNEFHVWFGRHYILRPSCQYCKYRKVNRQADITIGDFWGIEKVASDIDTKDGVSVLIARTSKANVFISKVPNLFLKEVDPVATSKVLKGYIEKRTEKKRREEIAASEEFVYKYKEISFEKMMKLYPCPTFLGRIKNSIMFRIHKYFKI